MKYYFPYNGLNKLFVLCAILMFPYFTQAADIHRRLGVKWQRMEMNEAKSGQLSRLILYNRSKEIMHCNKWSLWFNFIRDIDRGSVDQRFKIEHKNGNLFKLGFVKSNLAIPAGDSLIVSFVTNGSIPNFTDAPSGIYLTYEDEKNAKGYNISEFSILQPAYTVNEFLDKLSKQYHLNQLTEGSQAQLTIPSVLSLKQGKGTYRLTGESVLYADQVFEKEAQYFQAFVKQIAGIDIRSGKDTKPVQGIWIKRDPSLAEEAYNLIVNEKGITITAATSKGAFYAIQTIKSLVPAKISNTNLQKIEVPFVNIADKPRFAYRGMMLDVARNFQSKAAVLKVIDAMAMYKLNTLHLHLNDDEGWRLEIPALPELTAVGGRRNADYANGKSLQPAYGSGAEGNGKSFYSVSDYIEILKHAAKNHIEVIPELETPGHARAAIKSMEARYHQFMALGKTAEASQYLLNDWDDRSEYNSAQNWNDNVMNVAMPSTYNFINLVLDEMKGIYQSAGCTLKKVHLGGDEVPRGSWEKSPKIKRLADSLGINSVHQIWPHYIQKIAQICKSKGLELSGWEEMGMVNNGEGMKVNPALAQEGIQLDVWNNLVGDGQEDLAYKLANAGYKVVYTSANNFYFDLAWADTFEEPGHSWAGFTNVKKTYSFLPANYFSNIVKNNSGEDMAPGYFDKMERLTPQGRKNLIGIKGALWAEKVLNTNRFEYMLFPRIIALAERAWGTERSWETGDTFNPKDFEKDYAAFMKKLGGQELKKLDVLNGGYQYRLPAIGLRIYEESILCNTEYPGFDIFYTSDGTEPTTKSARYTKAIPLNRTAVYKFKVITGQGRTGETTTIKFN